MNTDGAKKSAKSPALRSLLTTDKALEMNLKLSHHVAFICEINNPPQLNSCEYGWERYEGEKSLRPTMLPTGIKIDLTRFCKQHAANVFQPSAIKRNTDVSEQDSTVPNYVIVNNAVVKVECTWMIMKLMMEIMIVKVAQKINNLSDMRSFVVLI